MRIFLLTALLACTGLSIAQTQPEYNSAALLQKIRKLGTTGAVLYVAAHPDDENTRLLAYLANERKLRTGYLSLTRGDGGQNLIGNEQGEALGLIRTNELLAARSVDGAEQFFTRANDFGYSKNPEETFTIWNRDSVLADVVWTIRKFRPDVIICRFPTTGEGGHGHHTASAMLAEEAFDAAADPGRFPEQLKFVTVWQPKRLFWNTFNFGGNNTTSEDQLKIDVGVYNTLMGEYYGETAAESRSMHKSQGFGSARSRGSAIEYFKLIKGSPAAKDILEGVITDWSRNKAIAGTQSSVSAIAKNFDPLAPEKSVAAIAALHKKLMALNTSDPEANYWREQKLKETEDLLLACAGFWAESYAAEYSASPGQTIKLSTAYLAKNSTPVTIKSISAGGKEIAVGQSLKTGEFVQKDVEIQLPSFLHFSNPYWLDNPHTTAMYSVEDQLLRGNPATIPPVQVTYAVNIAGTDLTVNRPLVYKWVDPVKGEIYRPFELLPPATVNISESVLAFADEQPKTIYLSIQSNTANLSGKVKVTTPEGWTVKIPNDRVQLAEKGAETVVEVMILANRKSPESGLLKATLTTDENVICDRSIERIEYDHIPYQFILRESAVRLLYVDVKKKGTNIAYIPGAGDKVVECLQQIGYSVTVLSDELITGSELSKYDAIITGVRAYNTNLKMQSFYPILMDYVKNGGNLIVQYNTNSRVGPVSGKIGPYAFTTSRNRVTNEKAEVRFTDPKDKVLHSPNEITAADFEGWVQERGIYFATEADPAYRRILSMNDPNEKPDDGSLIVAPYGKGNFVYTGLAFFRELPAGVPGAYRLFANLIGLEQNTEKK
jgi:LmbE family N-acetylglucosaminyl deacetylase